MVANIGNIDRVTRIVIGFGLLAFAISFRGSDWAWIGWIGVIPIFTAIIGICPAYTLLGVTTCATKADKQST